MFSPVYGICICHNQKRLIVVKAGFCKIGNDERKRNTKNNSNRIGSRFDGNSYNIRNGERKLPNSMGEFTKKRSILLRGHINKTISDKATPFQFYRPKRKGNDPDNNKKTSKKIKKTFKKATGEGELFKSIGADSEGEEIYCRCCKQAIKLPLAPHNFSHLLAKSTYSIFRLLKDNIWICCFECHHEYDFGDRSQPKFEEKRKEAFLLKQFYYSLSHEQRKSGIEWLEEAFRKFKANG